MNKKSLHPLFDGILNGIFVILCLTMIIFLVQDRIYTERPKLLTLDCYELGRWEWIKDDGTSEPISLPCLLDIEKGAPITVEAVLPDNIEDGMVVSIFNSKNCDIYIDNELRYTYRRSYASPFYDTVKTMTFFIPLSHEDCGKTIRFTKFYDRTYNGMLQPTYYGYPLGLFNMNMHSIGLSFFLAAFLTIVSLFFFIVNFIHDRIVKRSYSITYMSLGVFFSSCWCIFDSDFFEFIFNDYAYDGIMAFFLCMLIPFPFIIGINKIQQERYDNFHRLLRMLLVISFIIHTFLHFERIASFSATMYTSTGIVGFVVLCVLITVHEDIRKKKHLTYKYTAYGLTGFMLLTILDIISMNLIATSTCDGLLILTGLYFLFIMSIIQHMEERNNYISRTKSAIEANNAKTAFLAKISHEIRTPIHSIMGMNEMILRESNDIQIRDYAEHIERSGKHLLSLVNDILDLSIIESGKIEIIEDEYSLKSLLGDVLLSLNTDATEKGLKVNIDISPQLPKKLLGDEAHIKQILLNLISNAVKYTDEGSVSVSADITMSEIRDHCTLTICIKDTGVGIAESKQKNIFDDFTASKFDKEHKIKGAGLGLNIAKNLAEAMDGKITFESIEGEGSSFTLSFPQKILDPEPIGEFTLLEPKPTAKVHKSSLFCAPDARILVVDDTKENLAIIWHLLKNTRMKIDLVSSGTECLEYCKQRKYDIILMDHMMPKPDGIETMKLIRSDKTGLNKDTAIIVLTANAINGVREEYIKLGFDDYLSKPIDALYLEQTIFNILPEEYFNSVPEAGNTMEIINLDSVDSDIDSMRSVEEMDFDKFVSRLGNKYDSALDVLGLMAKAADGKVNNMTNCINNKDYASFRIEIHAVKGNLKAIFATALADKAFELETAAKNNDEAFINEHFDSFSNEYLGLIEKIKKYL